MSAVDVLAVMKRDAESAWRRLDELGHDKAVPARMASSEQARAKVAKLLSEAQAVLDHVEDEDAERVGNQCTLCHSYRLRLRAAIDACGEQP